MKKLRKAIHKYIVRKPKQTSHESVDGSSRAAATRVNLRKRNETPPKEVKRKRPLSISDSNNEFKKEVADQNASMLFKPPLEIREMIYTELFGPDSTIWIVYLNEKLACVRGDETSVPRHGHHAVKLGIHVLPFLQSCRRVYSEAIDLLYSAPRFAFCETLTFLAFSASILPSRFQRLRSITINLSGQGVPSHVLKIFPIPTLTKAHLHRLGFSSNPCTYHLNYSLLHDAYRGTLRNASVLISANSNPLDPTYAWDAVANALRKMKGVQEVFLSMRDVPRKIEVWVEHGYEHSGQRDARDIKTSLNWVGRDRPLEGGGSGKEDEKESVKRREAKIVFENVWNRSGEDWKKGHWVREVGDDAKVEWREVGEAAAPWDGEFVYW
ncbi:hypothetical protein K458DRAFT_389314 [Lentithecium fluviatile CBS 122367]|uniref:DUF7730 domain-containing protein n=1 Tax=Lentithecium fluviatile CBS 122367 TaxID=1168545 RepID=A0A6G1J1S2_9PLEO|nr:hypothetical protein K458DRAFT_389314 [Lentithecium fluviatile CBS 122367]